MNKKNILISVLFCMLLIIFWLSIGRKVELEIHTGSVSTVWQNNKLLVQRQSNLENINSASLFIQNDADAIWVTPFRNQEVRIFYTNGQSESLYFKKPTASDLIEQLKLQLSPSHPPFAAKVLYRDQSFTTQLTIPIKNGERIEKIVLTLWNPTEIKIEIGTDSEKSLSLWARPKIHHDGTITTPLGTTPFMLSVNKSSSYYLQIILSLLTRSIFGTFILLGIFLPFTKLKFTVPKFHLGKFSQQILVYSLPIIVFLITSYIAVNYFEKIPHSQDEVAYLFQAKIFSRGELFAYSLPNDLRRFFDHEFIINDGQWFGKYPPGTSLLLTVGELFRIPYLINPLISAVNIFILIKLAKKIVPVHMALLTAILLGLSPFFLLISSSYLSHPSALLFILLSLLGFVNIQNNPNNKQEWVLLGFGIGFLSLIRPINAVLIGVVFAIPLVKSFFQYFRNASLALFVVLIFLAINMFYNFNLTGNPFLSPYQLYSKYDMLGFGIRGTDFGSEFALSDAFRNFSFNIHSLLDMLFRWPSFLTLAFIPFAFMGRFRKKAFFLTLLFISQVGLYFFHFHEGTFYGPRFWFEVIWIIPLLTVMGLATLPRIFPSVRNILLVSHTILITLLIFTIINFAYILPQFKGFNGMQPISTLPVKTPALIFISDVDDNWVNYSRYFIEQNPFLDTPVIFARDQALHNISNSLPPLSNTSLMRFFSDRYFYILRGNSLSEI